MAVYIILLIFLFLYTIKGASKTEMILVLLGLAVVLGFRNDSVGDDTHNYIDYYNSFGMDIIGGYMEKGFNAIAVVCKVFQLSAYGFEFVVAVLTLLPFYILASRYNDNYINGYILFFLYSLGFYLLMFNGMRQFLAMSFLLFAFERLQSGYKMQFVFITILASFIHLISLCVIPLLFVFSVRFTTARVITVFALTFIVGIVAGEILISLVAGKYLHHIEDSGIRSGLLFSLTVGLLTNILFAWLYATNESLKDNGWVKLSLVSVMVLNLMSNLIIGTRVVYIFSVCSIFALALYLRCSENYVVRLVIYLYALVTFARYLLPEYLRYGVDGGLVPYSMNLQLFAI